MRDVTDNRTGELGGIEVKRGRGRPRKEGALSNAQRQAAYRARRRSESVTPFVTKTPRLVVDQVDAYDECRLEVDALRSELAEAHETIDELNDELIPLRATVGRLEQDVREMEGYVNGRDRENDHLVEVHDELVAVRRQLELAEQERSKAFAANEKLRAELTAAKKDAAKSVMRNGNSVPFQDMIELLLLASKARTQDQRDAILESGSFSAVFKNADVSSQELQAVEWALSAGKRASQVGV